MIELIFKFRYEHMQPFIFHIFVMISWKLPLQRSLKCVCVYNKKRPLNRFGKEAPTERQHAIKTENFMCA